MRDYERAVYILTVQTDEYVILDKITRFRQDIEISVTSKFVPMFVKVWQNNEDHIPWS